nr:WD40 repeat domain-containing protein [Bacteroidota bacterium]
MKKITLFLFLLASCMTSPGQTTEPLLRLNSEMHTSRISRMSMDAGGNRILTVSRDKTAKLWDAATGDLLMTFHPPIDKDGEGMLYAGALSPDGVIAAVGGWTGYKWDNSHSIYLFNANSGEMIQRLTGLGNVVTDLEFSIQGEYLAAAQGAGEGVRIYKHDHAGGFTFSLEKTLSGYESASYNICFSPSGNMVSACDDGYIRLYSNSFELIKKTKGSGQESFSVAFSPDGSKIAVGYYDVREVEVFDAVTLGLLYRPELGEIENEGNFYCVSFSADGECLFGGGSYPEYIDGNWWYIIRRWDRGGRGSYTDYPVCDNIIMDIKPVPLHNGKQGGVIFAGTLPDFGRIDQYGNMQFYKAGKVFSMNVTDRAHLKTESTGDVIAFKPNGEDAMMFSVSDRRLNPFEQLPGMESYTDQRGSISVGDWEDSYKPVINGEATGFLRQSELCRSVDISPYGDKIVCGANWSIYCTDGKGEKLWKTSIQSNAWAVNISQNSKTVVASMGEGIINWYRMKDGKLLLTLYINPDDRRWVLFTPEGYYDAAPGAEDLIGWHLNDGPDKEAYFFPASKFRNKYYRPDVIDNILATYDEGDALRIADLQNNRKSNDTKIANMLPPVVRILSPSHRQEVGSENLTIRYTAESPNGEPVTAVKVMIDGRPVSNQRGFKPMHDETGEITIQIPQKDATIQLLAENRHGWSTRAEVAVKWKGSDNKPDVLKPTLYMLAIGVSD